MQIKSTGLVNISTGARILAKDLPFASIHAVAGIANPTPFFNTLRELGFEVVEHAFTDHHRFSAEDLYFQDKLPVVMTEKDAVKCERLNSHNASHWYLEVSAVLPETFIGPILKRITQ